MSKFIEIEDIEYSQSIYLQDMDILLWLELEVERIMLEMEEELPPLIEDNYDMENWYSE